METEDLYFIYKEKIKELEIKLYQQKKCFDKERETFMVLEDENQLKYEELEKEKLKIENELKESRKLTDSYKRLKEEIEERYIELLNSSNEGPKLIKEVEYEYIKDDVYKTDEYIELKNKYDELYNQTNLYKMNFYTVNKKYQQLKEDFIKFKKRQHEEIQRLNKELEQYDERERGYAAAINDMQKQITNLSRFGRMDLNSSGIYSNNILNNSYENNENILSSFNNSFNDKENTIINNAPRPSIFSEVDLLRQNALEEAEKYKEMFEELNQTIKDRNLMRHAHINLRKEIVYFEVGYIEDIPMGYRTVDPTKSVKQFNLDNLPEDKKIIKNYYQDRRMMKRILTERN